MNCFQKGQTEETVFFEITFSLCSKYFAVLYIIDCAPFQFYLWKIKQFTSLYIVVKVPVLSFNTLCKIQKNLGQIKSGKYFTFCIPPGDAEVATFFPTLVLLIKGNMHLSVSVKLVRVVLTTSCIHSLKLWVNTWTHIRTDV